jgi:hypothetical protein
MATLCKQAVEQKNFHQPLSCLTPHAIVKTWDTGDVGYTTANDDLL